MFTAFLPCVPASQKGAPSLIIDGCEPPSGCWELNSGPLEEQPVPLTSEPSLQPCHQLFKEKYSPFRFFILFSLQGLSLGELLLLGAVKSIPSKL